jgi:hypothetical protein
MCANGSAGGSAADGASVSRVVQISGYDGQAREALTVNCKTSVLFRIPILVFTRGPFVNDIRGVLLRSAVLKDRFWRVLGSPLDPSVARTSSGRDDIYT